MKPYSLKERAQFYADSFPDWPPLRADDRWIDGIWVMGQNYTVKSGYYGGYPHGYLKRITSLFPDATKTLHLFSGSMPHGDYTRFDRKESEGVISGDAEKLSEQFAPDSFDMIYADPPYSVEDCEHYGCAMVNRNKVLSECSKVLQKGGYIVWLDQVLPMFRKADINWCGAIGMCKSTNHRFRVITIFKKL